MLKSKFIFLNNKIVEIIHKFFPSDIISEHLENEIHKGLSPKTEEELLNKDYLLDYSIEEMDEVIALLALSRYVYPILLNKFKTIQFSFPDVQFIGGIVSESAKDFIPTIRTALFVLSGIDFDNHITIIKNHFLPTSSLFRLNILKPFNADPFLEDVPLECTAEFIYKITTGNDYVYSYHLGFPAKLYSTNESWDDLCLNTRETEDLIEVKSWLKNYNSLRENPLIGKSQKGYKALFFGSSGTGKTTVVGLLGKEVNKPVYRIDISQITSKWVGETEKNLKYIFDLATNKNWILFFDEGDALFGKRSDSNGSNERHNNQEIAYLLQRMEEHEGIIFLCTNKQNNIDEAFKRRFNSRIEFCLPKKEERLIIWKKYITQLDVFIEEHEVKKIADNIDVSGASIKNFCKWIMILQYENLHKTAEQIEQSRSINKSTFLELMNKYFSRYEGKSINQRLFE